MVAKRSNSGPVEPILEALELPVDEVLGAMSHAIEETVKRRFDGVFERELDLRKILPDGDEFDEPGNFQISFHRVKKGLVGIARGQLGENTTGTKAGRHLAVELSDAVHREDRLFTAGGIPTKKSDSCQGGLGVSRITMNVKYLLDKHNNDRDVCDEPFSNGNATFRFPE